MPRELLVRILLHKGTRLKPFPEHPNVLQVVSDPKASGNYPHYLYLTGQDEDVYVFKEYQGIKETFVLGKSQVRELRRVKEL